MVGLLIALFAGTIALVHLDGVVPNANETVLSQLAHRSFGSGFMYAFTQAATAAILLLAANTAYNDFPRVLFLLARDFYVPRLFLRMGDRPAFSNLSPRHFCLSKKMNKQWMEHCCEVHSVQTGAERASFEEGGGRGKKREKRGQSETSSR